MTKSLIAFAALAVILASPAQAKQHLPLYGSDEVKPPVFAFSPKTTTDTRALIAVEPSQRVWTDDYRPAPPSF